MKKYSPKGTITALVTPFKDRGDIDFDALERLINFQIEGGVDGIVICGSTGESPTLTLKEKEALIIKSVEIANGKIPVIVGTGTNDTEMTLNMSVFAKEYGADALLIVTPYYNKPTQEGLFEHFRLIAKTVNIPVILYNVPGRTGVNMTAETQIQLAIECPNIVATKEASGSLEQMMEIIHLAPEHFSVLSGDDVLAVPAISAGAKGVISVMSNYAPKQFSECVNLALKGKFKDALKIHYDLFELMQLNFVETNPIPVKCIMSLMGLAKEVYRMPMSKIKSENKKRIKTALQTAGFIK